MQYFLFGIPKNLILLVSRLRQASLQRDNRDMILIILQLSFMRRITLIYYSGIAYVIKILVVIMSKRILFLYHFFMVLLYLFLLYTVKNYGLIIQNICSELSIVVDIRSKYLSALNKFTFFIILIGATLFRNQSRCLDCFKSLSLRIAQGIL